MHLNLGVFPTFLGIYLRGGLNSPKKTKGVHSRRMTGLIGVAERSVLGTVSVDTWLLSGSYF